MIKPVRKGEELPIKKLQVFLKENQLTDNPKSELQIMQFSNGYSNLTYLLQSERKEFVLRCPPIGAIKRGHDMSREYKVLSALHAAFNKTPQVYTYCEDTKVIGKPFYLMEKKEGIILTLKEAKNRAIPPKDFAVIADSWLNTFVELHQVNYEDIGLSDLGKPAGYVERQVNNWCKQYEKAATMQYDEVNKVMTWLNENKPVEYDHCLIHNDFKYDNIIFKDDTWKEVTAVLDWEMSTLGDPLMDLGSSIAYWTMDSDGPLVTQGLPSPTTLPGNPSRSEIVEQYAQKSGQKIDHIVFYYAFGLFKLCVIAQQIFYRYHNGLTTNQKFAQLDQSSKFVCLMAWQAIQKQRLERLF